ncbi:lipopolysaccharide biosynthesis protein [Solwaraspora sp. WMMD406]|uniref:lipopolysaccharide biosynthesis protein n=1 Tax=Solwaraspora sp. WMMD406 TaxID=3016095 RepID=UPI002416BADD|nr:lipopolysaccharide biosynthesis protein [Solwaraspora sp. WMMD406]MDG4767416.1 lipopolysaccharide biosynthesis protein [Solwaraspora sp. WMMD406]
MTTAVETAAGTAAPDAVAALTRSGQRRPSVLLRSAAALMTSTVASAALGFVFWVVAARWFPPETVGRASAAVSAMTLLAGLAQLNLVNLYARFLPGAGRHTRRLVLTGYAASAAMSLLLSGAFLALGRGTGIVGPTSAQRLFFVAAVLGTAIFFITDGVLTALRRAGGVPAKNVVASTAKVALLPLLAGTAAGDGMLIAWSAPMLLTMLGVNWWILGRLIPARTRTAPAVAAPARRELLGFASAEYVNGLLTNAVAFLPPVLVAGVLGSTASAYFYIPWVIGVAASTLLWNVVTSFVVTASSDASAARAHVDRAIALVAAVVLPGALVLGTAAEPLLRLLGGDYATEGAATLRLIGLSLPFTGMVLLYCAFAMMEKRMWPVVTVQSVGIVAFLALSWYGLPRVGIIAPAAALVMTQAAVGLTLLPGLIRRYRATGNAANAPDWAARTALSGTVTAGAVTTETVTTDTGSAG